jgi:hypothetical protein
VASVQYGISMSQARCLLKHDHHLLHGHGVSTFVCLLLQATVQDSFYGRGVCGSYREIIFWVRAHTLRGTAPAAARPCSTADVNFSSM